MTSEQEKNQAVEFAITDIGLTKDEAEQAFNDFYPRDENNYCDTCGKILKDFGDNKNCNDMFEDDYCNKCWDKKKINFEKITGYKWDSIKI